MEIKVLVVWYLAMLAFGIIGFPITNYLFPNWRDKGYGFAKLVGTFAVGIVIWFLASLKIVPFTRETTLLFFAIALVAALYAIYKQKIKLTKYMLIEEVAFLALFLFWSWVRAANPRAEGTEKMMNLAFMNSISRSESFPPIDPWYTGGTINYYYMGHFFFVLVGKVSGLAISYVYNLALVTIIAQTFTGLFSLFAQLFRKSERVILVTLSLMGATWICFAGNLHYIFSWLASYVSGEEFTYYFPNPTRIISNTINEFPAYSIVLGDVHGHYLALPFLVAVLGLLYVSYNIKVDTAEKYKFNAIISTFIVALYAVNSWDLITAVFLFTFLHLWQIYKLNTSVEEKLKVFALAQATLLGPGLIVMIPYLINFKPAVAPGEDSFPVGIVPLRTKSELGPWLLMWGGFLMVPVLYVIAYIGNWVNKEKLRLYPVLLTIAALCLIFGVEVFFLKDIFYKSNPPYFRTNTVFKFYYHAWVIMGVAATWFFYAIVTSFREKYQFIKGVFVVFVCILFFSTTIYIFKAIDDFYPLSDPQLEKTMDGAKYIEREHVGDYQAIVWLNENVSGQPVILEAVGDAYTYYARFSANTGLPTVMGWPTHEWQWRGDPDLAFSRKNEVDAFYVGSVSETEQQAFLNKYNVEYFIIGDLERSSYPDMNEEKLASFGTKVYEENNTRIYKVN